MKVRTSIMCVTLSVFVIGLTTAAWAVDMDAMKKKAESVKGQAAAVKKEGGETTQSAKDMPRAASAGFWAVAPRLNLITRTWA